MTSNRRETAARASSAAASDRSAAPIIGEFHESHEAIPREALLERRIGDLQLTLENSPIARLIHRLYDELDQAGLSFRPPVYLSDEWGCPDRVPIIGAPFYLARAELIRLEDEFMEGVEAESDDEIMRLLRHEAGHAFNYAYRLYDLPEWNAVFGPFLRPYPDDYTPNPFSRSFVRHLPGWYAQKHPDEDFAETFAVWLDPKSNWRDVYADWGCLAKLVYLDELARKIGREPPPVTADNYDTQEEYLGSTIAEHYSRTMPDHIEIPRAFDAALEDIFLPGGAGSAATCSAADLLRAHRRMLVRTVYHWTGLNYDLVRALVSHFEQRCEALGLEVGADAHGKLIEVAVLTTTLCMNRIHTGEFVQK